MTEHYSGKYIKREGRLEPFSMANSKQFELFVSSIPEGTIVECFYETQHDDGTLPQLAKIHVIM